MDNRKDNSYYLNRILTDIRFLLLHTRGLSREELEDNEVLQDSVMFRLIQISENSDKLTPDFKEKYPCIAWRAMKGLRNRIVHNYGGVDMRIIYDTLSRDIPALLDQLQNITSTE